MNIKFAVVVTLFVLFTACSKKEETASAVATEIEPTTVETPTVEKMPAQETKAMDEGVDSSMEQVVAASDEKNETVEKTNTSSIAETAMLSRTDALDLANKSGCLACHSIEKKVVGPAWQDVGARYKGDASVKVRLIDKVKKGGKGNWTEVTGGIPMPPYSPRVPDDTIEKLVSFVLSLPENK